MRRYYAGSVSITGSDYISTKWRAQVQRRAGAAALPGPSGPSSPGVPAGRRPWPVWAVPFAVTLGVLLARNAFLFSVPEYERADMGANSILIEQARRFTLLVGNYSRKGFNHPGPAFLYVESWGEDLFWAALRAVPTAWNGQLIAVYALNALFAASVVAVGYGWTRSARGALAAGAAVACLAAVHPPVFSSDWMPYVYVLPFLAFLVSLASVAAGQWRDGWIAALSGWFLVHGHAAFLFIVPAMVAVPAAVRLARAARAGRAADAGDGDGVRVQRRRRAWWPAAVISAVFALPMLLEVAVNGDGNFARYFAYGSSASAGGHSAAAVSRFVLWFWWPAAGAWPGVSAWVVPLTAFLAAGLLTGRLAAGPVRVFCRWLLLIDALAVAVVTGYAATGVDVITDYYIGYFSWATPAVVLLVAALAAAELLSGASARAALAAAAAAALAACAVFAAVPATRTSTTDVDPLNPRAGQPTDPLLRQVVAQLGVLAAGRVIVLTFPHDGWSDVTGILAQAGRTGVRACVASPGWAFMMSAASVCSRASLENGYRMSVYPDNQIPPGARPAARLQRAIVTSGTK